MAYYVFDDAKNKIEGMSREQIVAAIAEATGVTPSGLEAFVTQIKEQNAQNGVRLWVGTQNEYNAIQSPDANTLYIVTDPQETNELQNQVDLLQAKLDKMKAVIWSYNNGVANGETLEEYDAFSIPISDYREIVVTCGRQGSGSNPASTVQAISCVGTGVSNYRGSLYDFQNDVLYTAFIHRTYMGSAGNYQTFAIIKAISAPFSGNATTEDLLITQIRGLI